MSRTQVKSRIISCDTVAYALLFALSVLACGYVAKTQYGAQLDDCIDSAHSRVEADECLARVRLTWDEAGAKPALTFADAGDAQ